MLWRSGLDCCCPWKKNPQTTLHYIALHFIALHCTALHCMALHCTALWSRSQIAEANWFTDQLSCLQDLGPEGRRTLSWKLSVWWLPCRGYPSQGHTLSDHCSSAQGGSCFRRFQASCEPLSPINMFSEYASNSVKNLVSDLYT